MREVTIAFNKQMNHPTQGTYYRGCFNLDMETYLKFTSGRDELWTDPHSGRKYHFLNITGTQFLIAFLTKHGIPFKRERACRQINYMIEVVAK